MPESLQDSWMKVWASAWLRVAASWAEGFIFTILRLIVSRTPPWIIRQRSTCPCLASKVGRTTPLIEVYRPDPGQFVNWS